MQSFAWKGAYAGGTGFSRAITMGAGMNRRSTGRPSCRHRRCPKGWDEVESHDARRVGDVRTKVKIGTAPRRVNRPRAMMRRIKEGSLERTAQNGRTITITTITTSKTVGISFAMR